MDDILDFDGIVPVSTVDWHGHSSVVVFVGDCPFKCPYCQNYKTLEQVNFATTDAVWEKIRPSIGFVNAIVFSGGEPTIWGRTLIDLARRAKKKGLLVGVQSSGIGEKAIYQLVDSGVIDKFFIDVKAPLENHAYMKALGLREKHCLNNYVVNALGNSLRLIDESPAELELRTTVFRSINGT